MFRGKPAITKFDRLITPSRKSSQGFATPTGAALRRRAPSACSRLAHPASGLTRPTLRLTCASLGLGSPAGSTCWPIMQKVHCRRGSSCCLRPRVSGPPSAGRPSSLAVLYATDPRAGEPWGSRTPLFSRAAAYLTTAPPRARNPGAWIKRTRNIAPPGLRRRFFQQQVPLPLPCVNFAQIARAAIRVRARPTAARPPPTTRAFRA
jgi:hypothetical protein